MPKPAHEDPGDPALWHIRLPARGAIAGRMPAATNRDPHGRQALAPRHRSRRDQDRNRRARPAGRASSCGAGSRRRTAIIAQRSPRSRTWSRRRARARRPRDGGHRHARLDLARDRPAARLQLGLPQRPADPARSRGRARARGAHHQRRQLLRPVGGDRRRRRGRRRGLRRHPRHRRRRRHRRARPRARRPERASPASGATTRCPGRATTSVRAPRASAGARAASRPGCPVPGIERDHLARRGEPREREGHRRARAAAATPRARRRSRATRSDSPGRSRT